jgi:hypothetical protein
MEIKYDMFQGLRIIDTVYTNAGGFFTHLANTSGIKCRYILLEAKNYRFDLKNPEFDQISSRLIDVSDNSDFLFAEVEIGTMLRNTANQYMRTITNM